MESLIPILIGVAFFVLQAVASNNKKKRAAQQRNTPAPGHYPTPSAAPANPLEEWVRRMQQEMAGENEEENYAEEEIIEAEETVVAEEKLYPKYVAPAVATVAAPSVQSTLTATAETQSDEEKAAFAENIATKPHRLLDPETFDIEQAVVYSEILKPKFSE